MKIIIEAEPKEIAALVLAIQERQLSKLKEGVCLLPKRIDTCIARCREQSGTIGPRRKL